MESLGVLKTRSKAVKNVGQITRAMEVVAATKMRKAQSIAFDTRPYAHAALSILGNVSRGYDFKSRLSEKRELKTELLVIVASDKGLTGSFNTQVFRLCDSYLARSVNHGMNVITIGKKAAAYARRNGLEIAESYEGFGDFVAPDEVEPLSALIIGGFSEGRWDKVTMFSTHFRTALKQEVLRRELLPVHIGSIRQTVRDIVPEHGMFADAGAEEPENHSEADYLFEPSRGEIYKQMIPHLVRVQIYDLILEANASEHSARRVAMKTASDNADDLLKKLTLEYGKARQAGITKELIEITSAGSALG